MDQAVRFIQDLAVIMIAAALAGLLCKRIKLSPIVGYLLAGILIGPYTPPYSFVSDLGRIQLFAELGMVFLMFGIGLTFSLRRLRQLGLTVVLTAFGTAFLVFTFGRSAGALFGLDRTAAVFYAALLVVSSSAVIGKVLTETGRTHEKSSQLALGVTLGEDIVAMIMLTLLGSYARFGGGDTATSGREILSTLALFAGFVLVLATVGLLVIPQVLRRLSREATSELETIFVAGLLFGVALMVVRAGYSLALGAFLLGAIVAETPQRAHVERAFSGLRDLFGAIFFVAIGMSIDVSTLPGVAVPLVVTTFLAIVGRALAATTTLVLLGYESQVAVRAALIVTPIGEFSFIIARLGTERGLLPNEYMAAAVGVSLATALLSPVLIRHNRALANVLTRWRVPVLGRALELHRGILATLQRQQETSLIWKLTRKRLLQIGVEVALVTTVLIFAESLIRAAASRFGPEVLPNVPTAIVGWVALGLLLLAPLIAIWRNLQALSMILADYLSHQRSALTRIRPLFTSLLQITASLALVLWLWNFIPLRGGLWPTLAVLGFLLVTAIVLWRRLIYWHSTMEVALETSLAEERNHPGQDLIDRYAPWGLHIGEVTVPDRFALAGKSIGELGLRTRFGCSIISIERQGFQLTNPGPASHLFSGDRLLLLGTDEQIAAAKTFLLDEHPAEGGADTFGELAIELVEIPAGCRAAGQNLATLNWPRLLGVQIVGHERGSVRTITPSGQLQLEAGDRLLVLGTPKQIGALRESLR